MLLINKFVQKFKFDSARTLQIGIERECFIRDVRDGLCAPRAVEACKLLQAGRFASSFTPELSACMLEYHTAPADLIRVSKQLVNRAVILNTVLQPLNLQADFSELAEADMPLDVYPDERYQAIAVGLDKSVLTAACRVAGTHIHIGMPDLSTARWVYNQVRHNLYDLMVMGDKSHGQRLRLYKKVTKYWEPPHIESEADLFMIACEQGFVHNPRDWWSLIRITIHGTIEFRMFGSTTSIEEIVCWAYYCQWLCKKAML